MPITLASCLQDLSCILKRVSDGLFNQDAKPLLEGGYRWTSMLAVG